MNLKVRIRNPVFWAQLLLSIFVPIGTYFGLRGEDVTSWRIVFELFVKAISNPYVLVMIIMSVWNALNDPTTAGLKDSALAMSYEHPKKR